MKSKFEIPARENVSPANQNLFDMLKKGVGFVPNLYAVMAHSGNGLSTFLNAHEAKSSLTNREKEAVSLVVSQVNECDYCLSAHTFFGEKAGFTAEQMMEIRNGSATFNLKLNSIVRLSKAIVETRGHVDSSLVDAFFAAGYSKENLIDLIILVALKSITNYAYGITKVDIDWPAAPILKVA